MSAAVEAASKAIADTKRLHTPPAGALHVSGSIYSSRCSCGKWSVELESDDSISRRTGRTTIQGQRRRDRAKRAHEEHLDTMLSRAVLTAALPHLTERLDEVIVQAERDFGNLQTMELLMVHQKMAEAVVKELKRRIE